MAPRPPSENLPRTSEAGRLAAFSRSLGCDVGVERSCKLAPGGVESGRFLLSYGADARTARLTGDLLRTLALPRTLEAEFMEGAARAHFLHLGYEDGPRGPLLKAYCEGEPVGQGRPLYTAFKWRPSAPETWSIDDYWLRDVQDAGAAAPVIEAAFGPALAALTRECLALAATNDGEAAGLLLLEVERRGAGRRSFDLRLYGGRLTLADAGALVGAAAAAFGLGDAASAALRTESDELGHLSGGRDDAGAPFLTLYHGARAFA